MKNTFLPPFSKKLRKLQIIPSAVGMASNFGHRSHSRRSSTFDYGRRILAFGPTLQRYVIRLFIFWENLRLNSFVSRSTYHSQYSKIKMVGKADVRGLFKVNQDMAFSRF